MSMFRALFESMTVSLTVKRLFSRVILGCGRQWNERWGDDVIFLEDPDVDSGCAVAGTWCRWGGVFFGRERPRGG
jgi:hypothetical protein